MSSQSGNNPSTGHPFVGNQIALFIDFENVALWAEQEFLDFELTPLIEYLQSRGPLAVKRVYGDWSRFSHYREDLMNNSLGSGADLQRPRRARTGPTFAWRSTRSRRPSRGR